MIEVVKNSSGMFKRIPKAVPFILVSIFFERYTSGGIGGKICNESSFKNMKLQISDFSATLSLFFNRKLGFDPSFSTALFHTYEFSVFFLTIIGAIIADTWLGLYKTLLSMSCVYAVGAALIALGTIEPLNLPIS